MNNKTIAIIFAHISIFCFLLMSLISIIGYLTWYNIPMMIIAILGIIMLILTIILLNKFYIEIYNQPTIYERIYLIISPSIIGIGCINIYLYSGNIILQIVNIIISLYILYKFFRVKQTCKIISCRCM